MVYAKCQQYMNMKSELPYHIWKIFVLFLLFYSLDVYLYTDVDDGISQILIDTKIFN